MTFPTAAVDTTDLDADTDSPLLARQDLLDLVQKFNQILAHVSVFSATVLDDVDGAAWRATIGAAPAWPAGTAMLFQQTSAPTGWTKQTTHNDKALRVVSGTAGSGGATAFTSVFGAAKTAGAHTLTLAESAAHSHSGSTGGVSAIHGHQINGGGWNFMIQLPGGDGASLGLVGGGDAFSQTNQTDAESADHAHGFSTSSQGGGGSHDHTLSLDLQYVDIIIATKD